MEEAPGFDNQGDNTPRDMRSEKGAPLFIQFFLNPELSLDSNHNQQLEFTWGYNQQTRELRIFILGENRNSRWDYWAKKATVRFVQKYPSSLNAEKVKLKIDGEDIVPIGKRPDSPKPKEVQSPPPIHTNPQPVFKPDPIPIGDGIYDIGFGNREVAKNMTITYDRKGMIAFGFGGRAVLFPLPNTKNRTNKKIR